MYIMLHKRSEYWNLYNRKTQIEQISTKPAVSNPYLEASVTLWSYSRDFVFNINEQTISRLFIKKPQKGPEEKRFAQKGVE